MTSNNIVSSTDPNPNKPEIKCIFMTGRKRFKSLVPISSEVEIWVGVLTITRNKLGLSWAKLSASLV